MKMRKVFVAALVLLLVLSVGTTALAANSAKHVTDSAGVLTLIQVQELEKQAEKISREYGCGVYIVTVNDFQSMSGYSNIEKFSMDFYEGYNLGWGENKDGILLLLSMADRDFCTDTYGEKAQEAFNNRGLRMMEDRFLPFFGANDYYGGFAEYLNACEEYLESARNGKPVGKSGGIGIFSAIPGAFAALFTALGLKAPMTTVKSGINANAYIIDGSLSLQSQSDRFVHRTVTRQRRQTNSGGSSGRSSSFSSGGHSGRSGKF